jgi:hypothetical protein
MKKLRENLLEAKLNLPKEYIEKVEQEAHRTIGGGARDIHPTHQELVRMGQLLGEIMRIQHGHEDELTEIGKNVIQKFYGSILHGVKLDIKIVDPDDEKKLEMAQKMQVAKIEEEEVEVGEHEVDKRKLINNIMQGEAQNVHSMMYDVKDQVAEVTGSEELLDLYMEFLELNRKFDWSDQVNLEQMIGQNPAFVNAVEVSFDDEEDEWWKKAKKEDEEKEYKEEPEEEPKEEEEEYDGVTPKITARVLDLPMLVHETVKGIYELIAAKAIHPDPKRAEAIMQQTDTLRDEQKDIRYGPFIARDLRNYVNKVVDTISGANDIQNIREFVFGKMIELPAPDFVKLIQAILMEEEWPAQSISKFIKQVQQEFKEYHATQMPGYEEEPKEEPKFRDEELPTGVEEEPEERQPREREIVDKGLQPKKRKWVELSQGELNFELNKAIDAEDWETAKEIQKWIKESVNEEQDELSREMAIEDWINDVYYHLVVDFEMSIEEASDLIETIKEDLIEMGDEGMDPLDAAEIAYGQVRYDQKNIGSELNKFHDEDIEDFPKRQRRGFWNYPEERPDYRSEKLPDGVEEEPEEKEEESEIPNNLRYKEDLKDPFNEM